VKQAGTSSMEEWRKSTGCTGKQLRDVVQNNMQRVGNACLSITALSFTKSELVQSALKPVL
jgi:hypothetical protein